MGKGAAVSAKLTKRAVEYDLITRKLGVSMRLAPDTRDN
jgi:hypothetical protein